jgi:Na+/melibiose symporter-like transporter
MQTVWYLTMPAIFNVGWASVQIAHLSIVNSLTYGQRRRDKLINFRNGFTYIANVVVLTMALMVFLFVGNQTT